MPHPTIWALNQCCDLSFCLSCFVILSHSLDSSMHALLHSIDGSMVGYFRIQMLSARCISLRHTIPCLWRAGDKLYFLDPHTQQPFVDLSATVDDMSFHCQSPSSVDISQLDPSIAVVNILSSNEQPYIIAYGDKQHKAVPLGRKSPIKR